MDVSIDPATSTALAERRARFLDRLNAQFVHYSWLERGFGDAFSITLDARPVGYAVVGGVPPDARDAIVEFFMEGDDESLASRVFAELVRTCGVRRVIAQTNDPMLSRMLHEFAMRTRVHAALFRDHADTFLSVPGACVRRIRPEDHARVFQHHSEPIGAWGVVAHGEIVATGGILSHYNAPFVDVHMEVHEPHRGRGYGSLLVQELRRAARAMGRTPAARSHPANAPSHACLRRGGFEPCGELLEGEIVPE